MDCCTAIYFRFSQMDGTQKSCPIHCCLIHHCLGLSTLQALNVYGGVFSLRWYRTDADTGKAWHRASRTSHRMSKNRHSMTYAEWGRCSGTSAPSPGMILMLYRKRLSGGVSRKAEGCTLSRLKRKRAGVIVRGTYRTICIKAGASGRTRTGTTNKVRRF